METMTMLGLQLLANTELSHGRTKNWENIFQILISDANVTADKP